MNESQPTPVPQQSLPAEFYLTFAGEINELSARHILNHFAEIQRIGIRIVHFMIQSPGGMMDAGICLHNRLRYSPIEVRSYNMGAVDSAAVPVFLAGRHRVAAPNATFSVHKTVVPYGVATAAIAQSKSVKTARLDEANEAIIREHANMPDEKWKVQATGDLNISAEEAKEFGLIHEVEYFAPPMDAKIYNILF